MTVYLVGGGPGAPGLVTVEAAALLARADVVVFDGAVHRSVVERVARPGAKRVDLREAELPALADASIGPESDRPALPLLVELAATGETVLRLLRDDPFASGTVLSEVAALRRHDVAVELVAGVTAPDAAGWIAQRPLLGFRVVNPRAAAQASGLTARLHALGAAVVEVPTIKIAEPRDGGEALRAAVGHVGRYDWVVLTSPNGAERFCEALGDGRRLAGVRLAAIGPGTASVLAARFLTADLVPERYVAESLLEAFPPGPGRVLLARAAVARDVLPDGLAAAGWDVDVVEAYRTVPADPPVSVLDEVSGADAVVFTSSSTVTRFLESVGRDRVPPVVAAIGPVTAATAREAGIDVSVEAPQHTIEGVVTALSDYLGPMRRGIGAAPVP